MKFAKELEREAVPEWRIKYLNYKAGKKHVKAIAKSINRATVISRNNHRRTPTLPAVSQRLRPTKEDDDGDAQQRGGGKKQATPKSEPIDIARRAEDKGLTSNSESLQYGSFVPTPPSSSWPMKNLGSHQDEFRLPAAAIDSQDPPEQAPTSKTKGVTRKGLAGRFASHRSYSCADVPKTEPVSQPSPSPRGGQPSGGDASSSLKRIMQHTMSSPSLDLSKTFSRTAMTRQSLDLVRKQEQDFYAFMGSELQKVEAFYKQKEQQAGKRLDVLREQLHEMRNRRLREMALDDRTEEPSCQGDSGEDGQDKMNNGWVHPLRAKLFPPGPNSKALKNMPLTPHLEPGQSSPERAMDYVRRSDRHQISYRVAKRKLKRAILEFYRSLELLKSYALLNRTAFRKLNKKFDKAVHAQPSLRFVSEKVNHAYFVNSVVIEGHMKTVEDLYSRYFERGNQKLAAGKLRRLTKRPKDESGSAFVNGILIGTGVVFAIQGLIYAIKLLSDENPIARLRTGYLLQIYGGYFLVLLLFFFFCANCYVWNKNKVNYPFIFEFDQRTQLDWRELSKFPSFCLFLLGVVMWANFSQYGGDDIYLYYPVLLISVTVLMIFFPAPVLAYRSRKWFVFSHGRLLLAGLYPVEFRDFFLGDMYCSLTYAMANVELFFCLYARDWVDPPLCNSAHSRLLGFFTTLPPIWRFLQCIRRYRDTGNVFPHLVNCGKYSMSIIGAVCLSLYRIHRSDGNLALFITFNMINAIYCAIWDLFMDFSLLQPTSRHFYLRDITAFKRRWIYYVIMSMDPVLRFSWIFYAIFTYDAQHSTIVSFMIGVMEVCRRGMWALLRVENEHCGNVEQYKASRDVPLPYRIEPLLDRVSEDLDPAPVVPMEHLEEEEGEVDYDGGMGGRRLRHSVTTPPAGPGALESQPSRVRRRATTVHMRYGSRGFSQVLADAHMQDFERKRRPEEEVEDEMAREEQSDDDDDDEDSFMDVTTPRPLSRSESAV